jgi:hypothetical protein
LLLPLGGPYIGLLLPLVKTPLVGALEADPPLGVKDGPPVGPPLLPPRAEASVAMHEMPIAAAAKEIAIR